MLQYSRGVLDVQLCKQIDDNDRRYLQLLYRWGRPVPGILHEALMVTGTALTRGKRRELLRHIFSAQAKAVGEVLHGERDRVQSARRGKEGVPSLVFDSYCGRCV